MTAGGSPRQIFVSYAHADAKSMERLLVYLKHIAKGYKLTIWNDRRLAAGTYWDPSIEAAIRASDIFVMVISPSFLGSDYIYDKELPLIVDQHKSRNALLLPIILSGEGWRSEFGPYIEVLPKDKHHNFKHLNKWNPKEEGYSACGSSIDRAISDWFGIKPNYAIASMLGATP